MTTNKIITILVECWADQYKQEVTFEIGGPDDKHIDSISNLVS